MKAQWVHTDISAVDEVFEQSSSRWVSPYSRMCFRRCGFVVVCIRLNVTQSGNEGLYGTLQFQSTPLTEEETRTTERPPMSPFYDLLWWFNMYHVYALYTPSTPSIPRQTPPSRPPSSAAIPFNVPRYYGGRATTSEAFSMINWPALTHWSIYPWPLQRMCVGGMVSMYVQIDFYGSHVVWRDNNYYVPMCWSTSPVNGIKSILGTWRVKFY